MKTRAVRLLLTMSLGLTLMTGCGSKGDDLETMTQREMAGLVESKALDAATLLGLQFAKASISMLPCTGRGGETDEAVLAAHGTFQLPTGAPEMVASIERIAESWKAAGLNVGEIERFTDGGARATAHDGLGFEYTAMPTTHSEAVALFVDSPCFNASDPDSNYLYAPSTPLLPAPSAT